jgi:RNA polymerase sigma-70 factor (ECF subfamily)
MRATVDPTLLTRAVAGDRAAFRELVQATHGNVYRLALRLGCTPTEAEDVVQESFVRAWQSLATVRDPEAVVGWLFRVARNLALDRRRSASRRRIRSLDAPVGESDVPLVEQLPNPEAGPEQRVDTAEVSAKVRTALAGLKEKHRVILRLREIDGLSYEEIAETLGIALGTVESRIFRARQELVRKLKGLDRELKEA